MARTSLRAVAAVALPCFTAAAATGSFHAFGADTGPSVREENFYPMVRLAYSYNHSSGRPASCPDGAGPTADPLGPCFVSPADVKAQLDAFPPGCRAINLAGQSMIFLDSKNASAQPWGGEGSRFYMDTLPGLAGVHGPWADEWAKVLHHRIQAWFAQFKAIGGEVDAVVLDFEAAGMSESYEWPFQPTADGSNPIDSLVSDPRWGALRRRLDEVGEPYNVSFGGDTVKRMRHWRNDGWEMYVWSQVVRSELTANILNASVFEPIRVNFPHCRLSNWRFAYHSDPSGKRTPRPLLWANKPLIGNGMHVGTHQSHGFYGEQNSTRTIASQTPGPSGERFELPGDSFTMLLHNLVLARDMVAAAPTVPVQPWIAPKWGLWKKGWSYLNSGHTRDEQSMWEENLFHLALTTGTQEFLFWRPSWQNASVVDPALGVALLSRALKELDFVTDLTRPRTGSGSRRSSSSGGASDLRECSLRPVPELAASLTRWTVGYVMSAMEISCDDGVLKRQVFRFTPRCTGSLLCMWYAHGAANHTHGGYPANGTRSPTWVIGSSGSRAAQAENSRAVTPVDGGRVLIPPGGSVSSAGVWLVREVEGVH
jgi:hypothetical protein